MGFVMCMDAQVMEVIVIPRNLYTLESVEKLIEELESKHGYSMETISEGTLGLGKVVMIAPNDNMYNFVIQEVYLNEWSCEHSVRRCARISKRLQAEIDAANF